MQKETFKLKRIARLHDIISDELTRIEQSLTKRQENNARKRIEIAENYLLEYETSGFWNSKNTWIYENIYKDLPENTSVSAW